MQRSSPKVVSQLLPIFWLIPVLAGEDMTNYTELKIAQKAVSDRYALHALVLVQMLEIQHTLLPLAALNWASSWFCVFSKGFNGSPSPKKEVLTFYSFNITTPLVIFSSPRVGWLTRSMCLFPRCDAVERGPHHFLSAFSTLHACPKSLMFLIVKMQTDPKRYEFICQGIERWQNPRRI